MDGAHGMTESVCRGALGAEVLDRSDLPLPDRRRALRDLRRVNLFLLGRRVAVRTLLAHVQGEGRRRVSLLDVAAGAGDVTAALERAARRRGIALETVALDRRLSHLVMGRATGEIGKAVVARAQRLPFRRQAFDWCFSSLFFHHLDVESKRRVSGEMRRVGRRGAMIVDLRPCRWAVALARLLMPLLGIGRIAREDGLVSIRRSSTLEEWSGLLPARQIAEQRRRFPARLSVVLKPAAGAAQAPSR